MGVLVPQEHAHLDERGLTWLLGMKNHRLNANLTMFVTLRLQMGHSEPRIQSA